MSDPRIALVAEGDTDLVVIEAALKAILQRPFVLNLLQPEPSNPKLGTGWGGVFKWCREFRQRGADSIESDVTLKDYDLVIVHIDADVADKGYADCGPVVVAAAAGLAALPCALPCPPPDDTVHAMEQVLLSWLGIRAAGARSILCIPSKATEAWLASAVLPDDHALLDGLECNLKLETHLGVLPKDLRIRKAVRVYRERAGTITARWDAVKARCTQAALFDRRMQAVFKQAPAKAPATPPPNP